MTFSEMVKGVLGGRKAKEQGKQEEAAKVPATTPAKTEETPDPAAATTPAPKVETPAAATTPAPEKVEAPAAVVTPAPKVETPAAASAPAPEVAASPAPAPAAQGCNGVAAAAPAAAEAPKEKAFSASEIKSMVEQLGESAAVKALASGKGLGDAQAEAITQLRAENAELKTRLEAIGNKGEKKPAAFTPAAEGKGKTFADDASAAVAKAQGGKK